MTRVREVYYYDYGEDDFGLSGFAGELVARTGLRVDEGVTLALAGALAETEDVQLGADVRLLLDSTLADEVLHTVWLAVVRRRFDPVEEGTDIRGWLRRVSAVCPPCVLERDPYEVKSLDEVRPVVPEEELCAAVVAEIESATAGLARTVAVPDVVPALLRVVREVDADLGLRLFLRAAKAYSVTFGKEAYDRLVALGDRLTYPWKVVAGGLEVRWPPVDPGRRDLGIGRFGVQMLAAAFRGTDWYHLGTVRGNVLRVIEGDYGDVPGSYAAVLLEDARRLLDSALSDAELTALWRAVSRRVHVVGEDEFDVDVRAWLERVAGMCLEHLAKVDPCYVPYVSPARAESAEAVLREVREAMRTDVAEVRAVSGVLEGVVTTMDPDLGFRLLLQLLATYDVPVTDVRRARYRELAERLGYSPDHVDDTLPEPED
ncbi:hypothetical protein ABZ318_19285 [Streptomyces sp. NPDC006197]|uniref:hypothetical protein n=1 Tax=Streptomyces sp. NPDC006197 TaxID=3156685 RepID=UPI0033A4DC6B